MALLKRVFLFMAVNALVIVTLSLLLNLLGVGPYLTHYGINYSDLMAFCLVWGMGGSFISLALSRILAKTMMGVRVIDPRTQNPEEQALLQTVHQLARSAHLPALPEVGIYSSAEVNAFATGPTRSRALVAVSQGLLQRMNPTEIEGVLGHEISHIANGDMVTMTLLQGIVNAFAMFLSRAIAFAITQAMRSEERSERNRAHSPFLSVMIQMGLEMLFLLLGSLVIAWFSRYREYRADAGGARLAGRNAMIQALERLRSMQGRVDPEAQPAFQALKISGRGNGLLSLFASHPPLEDRIERLRSQA